MEYSKEHVGAQKRLVESNTRSELGSRDILFAAVSEGGRGSWVHQTCGYRCQQLRSDCKYRTPCSFPLGSAQRQALLYSVPPKVASSGPPHPSYPEESSPPGVWLSDLILS